MSKLQKLKRGIAQFSSLDPTHFYLHHVTFFLEVAEREPCTYAELEQALNMSNAGVSRTANAMSQFHRRGKPGLDLMEIFRDAEEGRRYMIRLTSKGKALLRSLEQSQDD